ncbi:hypothetical protein [Streptomyces caniferus]|uniref:hypothetical protein n=1 Tax=Streptomyces caniferus TaxID=285557 RepID=UPI003810EEE9
MCAALVDCSIVAAAGGAATALAAAVQRWYGVNGIALVAVSGVGVTEGLGGDLDLGLRQGTGTGLAHWDGA